MHGTQRFPTEVINPVEIGFNVKYGLSFLFRTDILPINAFHRPGRNIVCDQKSNKK